MDPKACFENLIAAVVDADASALTQASRDLAGWFRKGGFRLTRLQIARISQSVLDATAKLPREEEASP